MSKIVYLPFTTKLISVHPANAVINPIPIDVAAWMQSGINYEGKTT
jgi:hypothetical protein